MAKMICDTLGYALLIAAVIVAAVKFAREWQRLSDPPSPRLRRASRSDKSDIGGGHDF